MSARTRGPTLPPDSVGAIVRPGWSEPPRAIAARTGHSDGPAPGTIGAAVLASSGRSGAPLLVAGAVASLALHAFAVWAVEAPPPAAMAQAAAPLVVVRHEVDLAPPPPAEPPPAPPAPPSPPVTATAPKAEPASAAPGPVAPAQAGEVVTADAPSDVLDFGDFEITTGRADRYAGGTTMSSGTSAEAVSSRDVAPGGRTGPVGGEGEGRCPSPVAVASSRWDCPWPAEADALGIDEMLVRLRVVVRADGVPADVTLLADPGHGFGREAVACVRGKRFVPARDASCAPHLATSPPLHVRFER